MKHWIYAITGLFCTTSLLFSSCDEVDEADRYIEMEQIVPERNVLLEEFTGQKCPNCPAAHQIASNLKEQYGSSFIVVSIHGGDLAYSESQYPGLGLMQPEGDEYNDHWGIEAWPRGILDRQSGQLQADDWSDAVRTELTKPTSLSLTVSADTTTVADSITINVDFIPSADIKGKLQLWITESNIIRYQLKEVDGKTVTDLNYTHNHVYRASVNGTWGEDIELADNVMQSVRRQIKIKDNWVKKNLSVVAFVYNDQEGVLQAAECGMN